MESTIKKAGNKRVEFELVKRLILTTNKSDSEIAQEANTEKLYVSGVRSYLKTYKDRERKAKLRKEKARKIKSLRDAALEADIENGSVAPSVKNLRQTVLIKKERKPFKIDINGTSVFVDTAVKNIYILEDGIKVIL